MDLKKILSWSAFILGLALVVCGWFLWGDRNATDVFVLNIAVSVVIYCLVFSDFLIKWYRPEDKSQRRIGNMGLKWGVVFIYIVLALLVMVLSKNYNWPFWEQLLLHGVAIVVLIGGFALVSMSASNIGKVHEQQSVERSGVDKMRCEAQSLHYEMLDKGTIPSELSQRVAQLIDDMHFISPANSENARILEQRFVDIISRTRVMVSSFTLNNEELATELSKAERTLKDRKATYSN